MNSLMLGNHNQTLIKKNFSVKMPYLENVINIHIFVYIFLQSGFSLYKTHFYTVINLRGKINFHS